MVLDGKTFSAREKQRLSQGLQKEGLTPGLATVLVGSDAASQIYVRAKIKACQEAGFYSRPVYLPQDVSLEALLGHIYSLNEDPLVHGILVQLPLPAHLCEQPVLEAIAPHKDVDCFHPLNLGRLFAGTGALAPCTPLGILDLIGTIPGYTLKSKKALVIGASNIVGKPMAHLLLKKEATVAVAHKYTLNLAELTLWADIIISATGVPHLIKEGMVREGTVLLDVGMHRSPSGLVGDCDFPALRDKALAISPVPGGVGPMTILHLLKNTAALARQAAGLIRGH